MVVYAQVRFDVETYGQMDLVPVGEDERIDPSGTLGGIDSDRDGLDMENVSTLLQKDDVDLRSYI